MANTALAVQDGGSIIEAVIAKGDLGQLSADQRARYYAEVCQSIGVNPLTKPFDYITLNGKLVLYATKTATDQLRTVRGVSIFKIDAETVGDIRIVHAYARDRDGREDMDIGAVNVKGLGGDALANAYMKALTKAKRRVTLSICGLGWLDESEVESVPSARPIRVNVETGEIVESDAAMAREASKLETATRDQLDRIAELINLKGLTPASVRQMAGKGANLLTYDEAETLIETIADYPDVAAINQRELVAPGDPGAKYRR